MKKAFVVAKFPIEVVLRILFYLAEAFVKWYDKYSADKHNTGFYE